ncbi:serine protein kinase PrkA [Desulfatitalea alkaliphila]|uniref:Serine protein kinase PrkA n=1 Tax=Desulfatitalea alkaliphila TaxID=2929485 RepID=A0AA41UJ35_9BACT|nr:serine protein kinase PrkA [Desulfatitalea alkaliphila]MCJ8500157.1 serine protein kinase PrkA [Desulfatitalea alkaliphila]
MIYEPSNIEKAMQQINRTSAAIDQQPPVPFAKFLEQVVERPDRLIRTVFQFFHDMVKAYVGTGVDEYPNDPESINYVDYDCTRLFVEGSDHPFFADRLFANRLIKQVESMRQGAQQNKIYIFDGPHGCGKSTFLNNLLTRFEEYANTEEGARYETVWRVDSEMLGGVDDSNATLTILERLLQHQRDAEQTQYDRIKSRILASGHNAQLEIPCPSHDNPLLIVPKKRRRAFLDELFKNDAFKYTLFTDKEYEWVFSEQPCTICSSLFDALLKRLQDPLKVYEMVWARPYIFNRRLGEGISVFNPGDPPLKQTVWTNEMLQNRINRLFGDSNQVHYIFSRYAKTNNGLYALMDIKSHNIERLIELHNIISEGVHKVQDIEENVSSLFMALMNPEDKKNIQNIQSFSDRIAYVNISYVLDHNTEVDIYRDIFGRHIDAAFLPRVLHNFARVIVSSRLSLRSEAMLEWIGDPDKYRRYCDQNLQLLKMEIYTGYIPTWLSEEDRKRLTAKRRRRIIAESENEGKHGISGRDAIKIFGEFYNTFAKSDQLIDMATLCKYFRSKKELRASIPDGFLDSLLHMYDYSVLQEVKEALYYYNEEQIALEIQNYIFAVNFEPGATVTSPYTGDKIEVTEAWFKEFEKRILGPGALPVEGRALRRDVQKEYATQTLTQEVAGADKMLRRSTLFKKLNERYIYNIKEKVLEPFLENENFRRAIKDYGEPDFKTYDRKIQEDVTYLIGNLVGKYRYTHQGAKAVCIYVIDNNLAQAFGAL